MHWRFGNGEPLDVDMSDLDFSCLSEDDFPGGIGSTPDPPINLCTKGCAQGLVFGRLWLTYDGNNQIHARDGGEEYNFDTGGELHPWTRSIGDFLRNCSTIAGRIHAGIVGTDYWINLIGEGTIGLRPFSIWDIFKFPI